MNFRSRSRNPPSEFSACLWCRVAADCALVALARSRLLVDPGFSGLPLGQPRANDHRIDEPHDLVPVGVVRPELRALAGVEPSLEQRAQDGGIDVRPVECGRFQSRLDLGLVHGEGGIVFEQPAVEPLHGLETDPASDRHRPEQVARQRRELFGAAGARARACG